MTCHTDVEEFRSVIPAQAGIQGGSALASGSASWIPDLALLARNDVSAYLPIIFTVVDYQQPVRGKNEAFELRSHKR